VSDLAFADEHEYLGYWRNYLSTVEAVSQEDISALLSSCHWTYVTRDWVDFVCFKNKIRMREARWLERQLDSELSAQQSIHLWIRIEEGVEAFDELLREALDLKRGWAVLRLLDHAPPEHVDVAQEIIESSKFGRSKECNLLSRLNRAVIKQILCDNTMGWSEKFKKLAQAQATAELTHLVEALGPQEAQQALAVIGATPLSKRLTRRLTEIARDRASR
jgi:hypothetical protein